MRAERSSLGRSDSRRPDRLRFDAKGAEKHLEGGQVASSKIFQRPTARGLPQKGSRVSVEGDGAGDHAAWVSASAIYHLGRPWLGAQEPTC